MLPGLHIQKENIDIITQYDIITSHIKTAFDINAELTPTFPYLTDYLWSPVAQHN